MTQKEIAVLAKKFGQTIRRVCSFKAYEHPEISHTTISHSAQTYKQFKKSIKEDKKRIALLVKSIN